MTLLGIETATSVCGAAVWRDGSLAALEEIDRQRVHAERLLPLIDAALRGAGTTARMLGAIAVSIGPGSFTGLRIGLSIAKGLSLATGVPLVAVPTLEALASRSARAGGATGPVLAALDARRDEVYFQIFHAAGGVVAPVGEPRDLPAGRLVEELGDRRVLITGDGRFKVMQAAVAAGAPVRFAEPAPADAVCSAAEIARRGEARAGAGSYEDPAQLEPRYIKEFFLNSAGRAGTGVR
jgi:tRNA threonylcarbamoyladenosine biosynthesis protein TsaB